MRQLVLVLGSLLALLILGCMGGGPSSSDEDAATHHDGQIRVGKRGKRKAGKVKTRNYKGGLIREGEYTIRLTRKAARQIKVETGKLFTGIGVLDTLFGELGQDGTAAFRAPENTAIAKQLGLDRTFRIRLKGKPSKVIASLEANDSIEWVEPVRQVHAYSRDPNFKYQWNFKALRMPQAWKMSKGRGAVVAVIDTGVTAGKDGFNRLLRGYDFVDNDRRPRDRNGHGTHVAGTIAQRTNNGIGVAGIAPLASILPVRVLDANGAGSSADVAEGIIWAVDRGANIINLSLGNPQPTEAMASAIRYAYENDVTVVAATGNDGRKGVYYPAHYRSVIGVGAVDARNKVARYSNRGKGITLVAPGGDTKVDADGDGKMDGILQETKQGGRWGYWYLEGTSMAAPHVSGVAALLYSAGVTDPDAIARILRSTAKDLGKKGWDPSSGYGMINPVRALERASKFAKGKGKGKSKGKGKGKGKGKSKGKGKGKAKGKSKGKSKGKANDGGDLRIVDARVRNIGPRRAAISWATTSRATTVVRTEKGVVEKDDTRMKSHRVVVQGRPGGKRVYTIRSSNGNGRASQKITVEF